MSCGLTRPQPHQAGNFVREEILSAFIRLVAHTPELQGYTASKLYVALKADISQESLTLAATWIIGEYSEVLLEGGIVDEEQPKPVRRSSHHCITFHLHCSTRPQTSDKDIVDLLISIIDSPYANFLTQQFVLAAVTKISSRRSTSGAEQDRIAEILAKYTTSPELELQQRAVEFASLFNLGEELREGVLERMPPPELKATVMGVGKFESDYSFLFPLVLTV
jgi:AP-1 complex subunit gamma-1